MAQHDLHGLVPEGVVVAFGRLDNGFPSAVLYPITVTLLSLEIAEYGTTIGRDGVKSFKDEPAGRFDSAADTVPSNLTALQDLAEVTAEDWYRWQLGLLDQAYAGIVPYDPEGLSDFVEWSLIETDIKTLVRRRHLNDLVENLNHGGSPDGNTPPLGGGPGSVGCCDNIYVIDGVTYFGGDTIHLDEVTVEGDPTWSSPVGGIFVSRVCPKYVGGSAAGTGTTVTLITWTDLAGATVTVTVVEAATVNVWATFAIDGNGAGVAGVKVEGRLDVDGTPQAGVGRLRLEGASSAATVPGGPWRVALAAGSHTLKLQGRLDTASGSAVFVATDTRFAFEARPVLVEARRGLVVPNGSIITDETCRTDPTGCCEVVEPGVLASSYYSSSGGVASVQTDCCPDPVSGVVCARLRNIADCECLDGLEVELTYNSTLRRWESEVGLTACDGESLIIHLNCTLYDGVYTWLVTLTCGLAGLPYPADQVRCDPLELVFSNVSVVSGCCTGDVEITVTGLPCAGGGEGVVASACCPDEDIGEELTLVINNKTGTCTGLPDLLPLTYQSGSNSWVSAPVESFADTTFGVRCVQVATGVYRWILESDGCHFEELAHSASCDPLTLTFPGVVLHTCCEGSADFLVVE